MFSLVAFSNDLMAQNGGNRPNGPHREDSDAECGGGNFRYVSLINRTSSFDSNVMPPPPPHSSQANNEKQEQPRPLKRSTSDQALPDSVSVDSRTFRAGDLDRSGPRAKSTSSNEPSLELNVLQKCKQSRDDEPGPSIIDQLDSRTHHFINLNKDNLNHQNKPVNGQHVPSRSINNSVLSTSLNALSNNSSMNGDDRRNRREINGQLILNNVNMSVEDAESGARVVDDDEISYSHIRYVNIFSILCCCCFPITGIFSIVYSRLAKKYYDMRDKENAKKYLSKSEWLLMLTFFFGLTLIAVMLAFLDAYYFKTMAKDLHRGALIARILH